MLTASDRAIVQASLPLVAAQAGAITGRFYERLFAAQPDLRNLFNQGNQASGEQKQALAGAVYAYAKHGGEAATVERLLSRIAHKHASLGVAPEMYGIVGEHLMGAIGERLGDRLTPEVAEVWQRVYWRLADELIEREAALYRDAGITPNRALREYQVLERVEEGDVAFSLRLVPSDEGPAPPFKPGQYVSIQVELPKAKLRQLRQYSLSDASDGKTLRVTVKKETGDGSRPPGAVSMHLAHHGHVGTRWLVGSPFGDLALDPHADTPVVMISAGVGITPMMAMRNHLVRRQPHRRGVFVHVARHGGAQILKRELLPASNVIQLLVYDAAREEDRLGVDFHHSGTFSLVDHARTVLAADADYYVCGPLPFMVTQRDALLGLGVSPQRIHFEVFGPDLLTATLEPPPGPSAA